MPSIGRDLAGGQYGTEGSGYCSGEAVRNVVVDSDDFEDEDVVSGPNPVTTRRILTKRRRNMRNRTPGTTRSRQIKIASKKHVAMPLVVTHQRAGFY